MTFSLYIAAFRGVPMENNYTVQFHVAYFKHKVLSFDY